MARTTISNHLISFLRNEEQLILSGTNNSDREGVMELYHRSKVTYDQVMREFTPEEVRMLCERTKVRVKMTALNEVWDAKKRFDKNKRLENRSEDWVNRMFEKAHRVRMVAPYSELEKEQYKYLAACHTKKDNCVRVDRWHRQRLEASESSGLKGSGESHLDSESEADGNQIVAASALDTI